MKKRFNTGWLSSILILLFPLTLIFFLGSQMAYSQVKGRFEAYQSIQEVTNLSGLTSLPAGTVVMVRGRIEGGEVQPENGFVVYQERPAPDREARYQEEFPLVFSEFKLTVDGGAVLIKPSLDREQVIQGELHTISVGDRLWTGFQVGDVVTVQGAWQPGPTLALTDVTGLTSATRADLLDAWATSFQQVGWVRNGLGFLSLLSLWLFVSRLKAYKKTAQAQPVYPNLTLNQGELTADEKI